MGPAADSATILHLKPRIRPTHPFLTCIYRDQNTFRILRERWFGLTPDVSDRGVLARGVPLPALAGSASSAAASSASAAAASSVAGDSAPAAASSYICVHEASLVCRIFWHHTAFNFYSTDGLTSSVPASPLLRISKQWLNCLLASTVFSSSIWLCSAPDLHSPAKTKSPAQHSATATSDSAAVDRRPHRVVRIVRAILLRLEAVWQRQCILEPRRLLALRHDAAHCRRILVSRQPAGRPLRRVYVGLRAPGPLQR